MRVMFKYKPHKGQIPFHTSKARHRMLVCGRRFGKSMAAAAECFFFLYGIPPQLLKVAKGIGLTKYMYSVNDVKNWEKQRFKRIWIVAPNYTVVREMKVAMDEIFPKELIVDELKAEKRLIVRGAYQNHWIEYRSADAPKSLVGAGIDLLIIDEAGDIPRDVWEQRLRATISDKKGRTVWIGTPRGKNLFYEQFLKGKDPLQSDYESWQFASNVNPYFPEEEFESARRDLPEAIFAQEYLAQFLDDAAQVFRKVDSAVEEGYTGESPKRGSYYQIGVDLARLVDFTVIIVVKIEREGFRVVDIQRFNQIDWPIQKEAIVQAYHRWGRPKVNIDCAGVGDAITQDLKLSGVYVNPVHTGAEKNNLINNLAILFEKGKIVLPDPHLSQEAYMLYEELTSYKYEILKTTVRYAAPSGKHDDCVMALALATHDVSHRGSVYSYSKTKRSYLRK